MHGTAVIYVLPMVMGLSFFIFVGWLVYVMVTNRRRAEQTRAVQEFHAKILERMGSAKEFGDFLQSEGGERFLNTLTTEPAGAKTRLLGSVQSGIVCLFVGVALLTLGAFFYDFREGLSIVGGILAACGLGFIISTVVSHRMSRAMGLLDEDHRPGRRL